MDCELDIANQISRNLRHTIAERKINFGTMSLFLRLFYLAVELDDEGDVTLAAAAAAGGLANPE